jgi:hypothetical protein
MDSPIALSFEGGSNTSLLVWDVGNLGHVDINTPLFLRVEIWPTDFAVGFVDVFVNDVMVSYHCSPGEDCGSEWHVCVSSLMVLPYIDPTLGGSLRVSIETFGVQVGLCEEYGQYVLYAKMALNTTRFDLSQTPSGQPSGEPTALPSGQPTSPSSAPSGEPTIQPSTEPSNQPSGEPTGEPTGEPSSKPSSHPTNVPSGQPSSNPTMDSPIALSFEGGSNTSLLVWDVGNLGHVDINTPLFIRVEIWPTNFAVGFADVFVNGVVVSYHCSPDEDCGSEWHVCVSSLMVLPYVDPALGGSLSVSIETSGVESGDCDYDEQYMLYAKMALNTTRFDLSQTPSGQPSGEPTASPSGQPTSPSSAPSGEPTVQPSTEPSNQPSGEPTGEPSSVPSLLPSLFPTMNTEIFLSFSGGSLNESVVWVAYGLGEVNVPLYLTVKVFPTAFVKSNDQYALIYINDNLVNDFCRPGYDCGQEFYTCFKDMDISDIVMESRGGSVKVEIQSVEVFSTECDHEGFPLYVEIAISDQLTTSSGTLM